MDKQDKKMLQLLGIGWFFDGSLFHHPSLSPEGCTREVAIVLSRKKSIDASKIMKQILRKGR